MKFLQPPLKITCDGLNTKLIYELADRLRLHFVDVEVYGETIYAGHPLNSFHYDEGWHVIDKFGVKAM